LHATSRFAPQEYSDFLRKMEKIPTGAAVLSSLTMSGAFRGFIIVFISGTPRRTQIQPPLIP
jgi:hypothetical protein